MNLDLTGQVALITGASRGIGKAIAETLACAGAHAVLAAQNESLLAAVAQTIREDGGQASFSRVDITDDEAVCNLFRAIDDEQGRLDIMINNAGIGEFGPLHMLSEESIDRVLDVNLRGTFRCCREAMVRMTEQKRGAIINISSVVGFKGYPLQSVYAASKHGIMGLTKSLAVEAQPHGIRVSAVLPGGVDTDMVQDARPDLNREGLLQPDDVAQAVNYLLSLSPRAAVDQIYIRRRGSQPFP